MIIDNLSSHKADEVARMLAGAGSWPLYRPIRPIEMAFSKLKALLRRARARTLEELWQTTGQICGLYSEQECYNYFHPCGYSLASLAKNGVWPLEDYSHILSAN